MTEKERKDMLVRSVPLSVRDKVKKTCERKQMKLRDFLEQAIILFEASDDGEDQYQKAKKAYADMDKIREITVKINAYKKALKLKKDIENVRNNIKNMGDRNSQMNVLIDVKKMDADLDKIISEYVPKHEIPEDPEARREMGLPPEYCTDHVDIPRDLDRQLNGPTETDQKTKKDEFEQNPHFAELKKEFDEIRQFLGKYKGETTTDKGVNTLEEKTGIEEERMKSGSTGEIELKPADPANEALTNEEENKEVETTVFGRGFDGLDCND